MLSSLLLARALVHSLRDSCVYVCKAKEWSVAGGKGAAMDQGLWLTRAGAPPQYKYIYIYIYVYTLAASASHHTSQQPLSQAPIHGGSLQEAQPVHAGAVQKA